MEGVWGTVCDAGFGRRDAIAVCRSIGLDYDSSLVWDPVRRVRSYNWRNGATGPSMPIVMTHPNCEDQEESILDCAFTANTTNCHPRQNVQVTCTPLGKSNQGPPDSFILFNIFYSEFNTHPCALNRANPFALIGLQAPAQLR